MDELTKHWTADSTEDYLYSIAADFVLQLESAMVRNKINRSRLAELLDLSDGRISQIFNNPGNLTLKKMIEYSNAIGTKICVVSYSDNDPDNHRGLINGQIFASCWELAGKPSSFFDFREASSKAVSANRFYPLDAIYRTSINRVDITRTLTQFHQTATTAPVTNIHPE